MSLKRVLGLAGLAALVLFGILSWGECWLFRYGIRSLVAFLYLFAWLLLFFAVRTKWRLVLLLVTIPTVVLIANGRWGIVEMNAGAESAAFAALRQMHSGLDASRLNSPQKEFPETLPIEGISSYAKKYYRFTYIPMRAPSGGITRYLVEATPVRRDCEFHRSFTITDDGRVFWTLEPRAATVSDHLNE
jgi:hypothetical protein